MGLLFQVDQRPSHREIEGKDWKTIACDNTDPLPFETAPKQHGWARSGGRGEARQREHDMLQRRLRSTSEHGGTGRRDKR